LRRSDSFDSTWFLDPASDAAPSVCVKASAACSDEFRAEARANSSCNWLVACDQYAETMPASAEPNSDVMRLCNVAVPVDCTCPPWVGAGAGWGPTAGAFPRPRGAGAGALPGWRSVCVQV